MKILDFYIARNVLLGFLPVLLLMLSLFSFIALVETLEDVGKGQFQLADALKVVIYTLPLRALDLMPTAALLGSVLGLSWLANHGELIAMRAAGLSVERIAWAVLKVGLFLIACAIGLGETVAPKSEQMAKIIQAKTSPGITSLGTEADFWSRQGQSFISVRRLQHNTLPADIEIFNFNDRGELLSFMHASQAQFLSTERWLLEGVTIKRFLDGGAESITHLAQLEWQSFLTAAQMDILLLPPESLPSAELYHYIGHLQNSGMDPLRYELALWQKISLPLKIGVMVLLGISFVFGSVRSVSISQRVLAGAVVAILFYLIERMSGYVGLLYRFNPVLTATVPAALLLVAAVWRFRQIR